MAINTSSPIFNILTIFLFTLVVLTPMFPTSDAARYTTFQEVLATRPICPACVCCEPPPPGSCCRCCASPVVTQSGNGSP
ncbi:Hypothetical predicted protein [Olea europaea subsp. europaea]|uniref:Transmembrane protein n=1 Tax=Olea europaea subsp. europaea TaxID=158383 RepID=A0A8S0Q4C6_OLEEU|nr:Hypothetical predicted protein [Olea europaea subsp. europaea]